MELSPTDISRRQFEQVRRGFDPQEVGVFLERVAESVGDRDRELAGARSEIQRLERALEDARAAEEAVRLTMVAATKVKEELLSEARASADAALSSARREALTLIEESRRDAEDLVTSARREHNALMDRAAGLRGVVKKTSALLKGMAAGALGDLAHAEALVESGLDGEEGDFEVVLSAEQQDTGVAADPVDRLLAQLREAGG